MYSIIQKIYEKNNKILKEGLKKVLSGEDVSSLTIAIKEFTDILEKELLSEIVKQIDEMSQLRAFTQNDGNIHQRIIDISTQEKRNKKIEALEKRIKRKANKKLFGTIGVAIPTLARARDELYYELKNIGYGKAV